MSDPGAEQLPGWTCVMAAGELPPGQIHCTYAGKDRVVLANVDGDFYALEDRCSHQDYPLASGELDGNEIECPFHGARFDVRTGRATQLPAIRPVRVFEAKVVDGRVYLREG